MAQKLVGAIYGVDHPKAVSTAGGAAFLAETVARMKKAARVLALQPLDVAWKPGSWRPICVASDAGSRGKVIAGKLPALLGRGLNGRLASL